jgi:hypothetical protein
MIASRAQHGRADQQRAQHGGRTLRVRGAEKAMCHLMFGVLCLTALQLVRLVT